MSTIFTFAESRDLLCFYSPPLALNGVLGAGVRFEGSGEEKREIPLSSAAFIRSVKSFNVSGGGKKGQRVFTAGNGLE